MYVRFSLYGEAWESLLGDDDEDVLALSTKKGKTINKKEREEKNNQKQTAFRAQTESGGHEVAVCCYDQSSYDTSSW